MKRENLKGNLAKNETLSGNIQQGNQLNGKMASTRYAKDYETLINKPYINGVEVIGHKISKDYKLQDKLGIVSEQDIDNLIFG